MPNRVCHNGRLCNTSGVCTASQNPQQWKGSVPGLPSKACPKPVSVQEKQMVPLLTCCCRDTLLFPCSHRTAKPYQMLTAEFASCITLADFCTFLIFTHCHASPFLQGTPRGHTTKRENCFLSVFFWKWVMIDSSLWLKCGRQQNFYRKNLKFNEKFLGSDCILCVMYGRRQNVNATLQSHSEILYLYQ